MITPVCGGVRLKQCQGMSSLDPKDAVADYSSLTEAQMKTLDQWESFFEKVRCFRTLGEAYESSATTLWEWSASSMEPWERLCIVCAYKGVLVHCLRS